MVEPPSQLSIQMFCQEASGLPEPAQLTMPTWAPSGPARLPCWAGLALRTARLGPCIAFLGLSTACLGLSTAIPGLQDCLKGS